MVDSIRTVEKALGTVKFEPSAREAGCRVYRRSIFVVEDVKAGEPFTEKNVRVIRPGHGLHPRHYGEVLAARAKCDIPRGAPLAFEHFH